MNLPDQPPTFRPPSPSEQPWSWRLENKDGDEVSVDAEYAAQRFPTQADAESWVGEVWGDLAEQGSMPSHCSTASEGLRTHVPARVIPAPAAAVCAAFLGAAPAGLVTGLYLRGGIGFGEWVDGQSDVDFVATLDAPTVRGGRRGPASRPRGRRRGVPGRQLRRLPRARPGPRG